MDIAVVTPHHPSSPPPFPAIVSESYVGRTIAIAHKEGRLEYDGVEKIEATKNLRCMI
jgi:hypothetical protein